MEYQKLDKKALKCMYVAEIINTVIIAAVLAGLYYVLKREVIGDKQNLQWILVLIPGAHPDSGSMRNDNTADSLCKIPLYSDRGRVGGKGRDSRYNKRNCPN